MAFPLTDTLQRPLRDLRISVTDRCNFRCTYCMPKEVFGAGFRFLPRADLLTFEEIEVVARTLVSRGVEKIRITGGEPLLRRDLPRLVEMLAALDSEGLRDLTLTTNGALLTRQAQLLRDAGLQRVTVSLDSLDDEVFAAMNDVGFPVAKVLDGIEAAEAAGLPVKVNMVVQRGRNDGCVADMAQAFRGTGRVLRFIEYMDVGTTNGWRMDDVVPATEILAKLEERWPLEPLPPATGRGGEALALQRRDGRDRRHRLGHPAVLRRLHEAAALGRRPALHLPVRRPGHRHPGRPPRRRRCGGRGRDRRPAVAAQRRPLLRDPLRRGGGGAARRDVPHRRLIAARYIGVASVHVRIRPRRRVAFIG